MGWTDQGSKGGSVPFIGKRGANQSREIAGVGRVTTNTIAT